MKAWVLLSLEFLANKNSDKPEHKIASAMILSNVRYNSIIKCLLSIVCKSNHNSNDFVIAVFYCHVSYLDNLNNLNLYQTNSPGNLAQQLR